MLNLGAVTAGGQNTHMTPWNTVHIWADLDWSIIVGWRPPECSLLQKHTYTCSVMLLTWFQRRPPWFLNQVVRVFPLTQFVLAAPDTEANDWPQSEALRATNALLFQFQMLLSHGTWWEIKGKDKCSFRFSVLTKSYNMLAVHVPKVVERWEAQVWRCLVSP